jgi:limonene-1,2-epoxide hydrolase
MGRSADVVNAFFHALEGKDFGAARGYLADHLSFQGPFDTFTEPDSYLKALEKLYPMVKSVTFQKIFEDGDDTCVLYEMQTNTPIGIAPICEWFTVRAGQIIAIRAIFDARPFAPMFSR